MSWWSAVRMNIITPFGDSHPPVDILYTPSRTHTHSDLPSFGDAHHSPHLASARRPRHLRAICTFCTTEHRTEPTLHPQTNRLQIPPRMNTRCHRNQTLVSYPPHHTQRDHAKRIPPVHHVQSLIFRHTLRHKNTSGCPGWRRKTTATSRPLPPIL